MLWLLLAAPPDPPGGGGSDLPIPIPELPEGTPGWVYAVVFAAVAVVAVVVKLPALIEGINSLLGRDTGTPAPLPAPAAPTPAPGPQQAAVEGKADDLAQVVEWLQGQVEEAAAANADLQARLNNLLGEVADNRVAKVRLEAEVQQLRTEVAVLRGQHGYPRSYR